MLRLDLRNARDEPIPFLTADQNAIADAALLVALANKSLTEKNLNLGEYGDAIKTLAGVRRDTRQALPKGDAISGSLVSLIPPDSLGQLSDEQRALRKDKLFVELAGALRSFTLLWLRVEGNPGDRQIVKLAYDEPFTAPLRPWSREAFGLKPFEVRFDAPHMGGSGSYHLGISVPPPLRVSDAAVIIREPRTAEGRPEETKMVAACTSEEHEGTCATAEGTLDLYAHTEARDARFYVSGPRTGNESQVRIAMHVQGSGLIRPGALAGLAITALLSAVALRLGVAIKSNNEAVVTTLLVAPALLAYLVVRPSDHAVVGQFVSALRWILVALGSLPLIAATAIAVSDKWHLGIKIGIGATAIIALGLSAIVFGAWLAPRREAWRLRFSSDADAVPATDESK